MNDCRFGVSPVICPDPDPDPVKGLLEKTVNRKVQEEPQAEVAATT